MAKPQTVDTKGFVFVFTGGCCQVGCGACWCAIDELPELMVTRIENWLMRLAKMSRQAMFSCTQMIVQSYHQLSRRAKDRFKIEPDPELYRGDIRIRFDGMDISDIADLRADWQISQSLSHENIAEVETAQTRLVMLN